MNTPTRLRTSCRNVLLPLALATTLFATSRTQATPYATSLTNNAGTISYRLNQAADRVLIVYTNLGGLTVTNDLGGRGLGLSVEALGVPGNFSVVVEKTNTAGYLGGAALQISSDATNTMIFNSPRGVAVNQNPASPYFGRIYVANSAAGTTGGRTLTGDGYFLINSDFSDAVGQGNAALTGGANFVSSVNNDLIPFRLEVGQDDNLYMSSLAATNGSIYVSDPNVTTTTKVLNTTNRYPSSALVTGSLGAGNLVVEALDTDTSPFNRIRRYNIGSGPLPASIADAPATNDTTTGYLGISGVLADLAKGPDGKYYVMQNRSSGGEAGIFVIDPNDDTGAAGFSTGGNQLWDVIYSSYADSLFNFPGQTNDILAQSRAVAISPDGRFMAIVRDDSRTWVVPLVNGLPDLANRKLLQTGSVTLGRDICFDAAGNLYVSSSGNARLRVYSPGFFSRAVTSSTGTFSVTNVVPPTVTLVNAFDAAEPATDGKFTLTRDGGIANPLTVQLTLSGTAIQGADYSTNSFTFVSNNVISVTFGTGVSSVDVDVPVIDDNLMEPTETVTLTLIPSLEFATGGTGNATVNITDDGDTRPVVSLRAIGSGFSELLAGRPAKFVLTTLLPVPADTTVNIALSGSAVSGVDYSEPATFSVVITNGTATNTFNVTPINNSVITSNRAVTAALVADAAYGFGTSTNGTKTLREDDLPAAPVVFSDNFDTDTSANWVVNTVGGVNDALFSMDYSTNGIPVAPNTIGGTTRGLRLRANILATGTAGGISASPLGLSLPADYRLRFDLWMNYNGPMPGGGTGSSEYFTTGVGVSETRTNVVLAATDARPGSSVIFSVDGDGGFAEATGDFIVHTNGARIAASGTSIYPAGARDNFDAYYAEFGELPAPAAQLSAFPNQTGLSQIGSLGSAWHDVLIVKQGNTVTWTIDGLLIATINYTTPTVGNNFSVGFQDINTSLTDEPLMNMAIVDNLRVESLVTSGPLITSVTLINGGNDVQVDFTGGSPEQPVGNYALQSTGDLTLPFGNVSATITSLGSGQFRAVRPVAGNAQFYRIVRTDP